MAVLQTHRNPAVRLDGVVMRSADEESRAQELPRVMGELRGLGYKHHRGCLVTYTNTKAEKGEALLMRRIVAVGPPALPSL